MNEQLKMKLLQWAQENVPATAGVLMAELGYQYSEEVEVDSAEMDASMEREMQIWKLLARGFAGYLFELRKFEADTEEADAYARDAVKVAREFEVEPKLNSLRDMVEWHMYSR